MTEEGKRVTECKSCKKEVAKRAKVCPHCGQKNPGTTMIEGVVGCLGIVGLVAIVMMAMGWCGGGQNEQPVQKKLEPAAKKKLQPEFAFNVEELLQRHDEALRNLNQKGLSLSVKDENDNGSYLTIQLLGDKNIGMVLTANNKTRSVRSVTAIGSGDGTMQSGLNIFLGMLSVVMAIEDPFMPNELRSSAIEGIGLHKIADLEEGQIDSERNGVKYSLSRSQSLGILLIAEPVEK